MKLYVWEDFFYRYTAGLAVAIANSEAEAKKEVIAGISGLYGGISDEEWGECQVFDINNPIGFGVQGGEG